MKIVVYYDRLYVMIKSYGLIRKSLALRLHREILQSRGIALSSSKIKPPMESRHWWWWWLMKLKICKDWAVMGRWRGSHDSSMKELRQREREREI